MASPTLSSASSDEEPSLPTRIGAGSFATVYSVRGQPFVFKVVHHNERANELRNEFLALHSLYLSCNSNSLFAIPRAIAYYNPSTADLIHFPSSPPIGRARDPRPYVDERMFSSLNFSLPSYAMDRAHALPAYFGNIVRDEFYPPKAQEQNVASPLMCRLYFGKTVRPSLFVNSVNFPLDAARYATLLDRCREGELLAVSEVAAGMGEMLGRIHWLGGYDGRDVEFVMAGTGISIRYYVIDFNQMRPFDPLNGDIRDIVDSFFSNDPYYPRPQPDDHLYQAFRASYLSACPEQYHSRAQEFLSAIEARHAGAA